MADAKKLIDALRDDFFRRCENDRKLKRIADQLEKGTYVDAHEYSVRIGELLSQSFAEVLTEDIYPELTEEMAREIIPSLLGSGHRRTADVCVQVQRNLNQQAGLGLRPIEPEFDVGRAYDLAEKYVSYDEWKDARWVLGEPVENFMQSVPDDSIRRNADFQWRSGMSPKIIRRAEPGACKWCRALAGTYDYADVRETGNDVYRRHERCRCVVEYDPGNGRRQNVHTKLPISNLSLSADEEPVKLSKNSFLTHNDVIYQRAKKVIPLEGYDDVFIHGDDYDFCYYDQNGNQINISVERLAELLQQYGHFENDRIRLCSCGSGAYNATSAQRLADLTGKEVLAPSTTLFLMSEKDGVCDMIVAYEDDEGHPDETKLGEWKSFYPRQKR